MDTIIKTIKHAKLNAKYCECCLEYTNVKNNLIECKCFCCNKNYQKQFDQILKERFSNHDINKFILFF